MKLVSKDLPKQSADPLDVPAPPTSDGHDKLKHFFLLSRCCGAVMGCIWVNKLNRSYSVPARRLRRKSVLLPDI